MAPFPGTPIAETWTEKFSRKFKENPLVPIGAAATVGTLIIASMKMRSGEPQKMNRWLRARVAAQGFTILAICGGAYMMNRRSQEALAQSGRDSDAESLKQEEERREFEKRLRDVEEAYRTESRGGTDSLNQTTESQSAAGSSAPPPSSGVKQSWLGWLGWNTGSRSQPHVIPSESKKENPS